MPVQAHYFDVYLCSHCIHLSSLHIYNLINWTIVLNKDRKVWNNFSINLNNYDLPPALFLDLVMFSVSRALLCKCQNKAPALKRWTGDSCNKIATIFRESLLQTFFWTCSQFKLKACKPFTWKLRSAAAQWDPFPPSILWKYSVTCGNNVNTKTQLLLSIGFKGRYFHAALSASCPLSRVCSDGRSSVFPAVVTYLQQNISFFP